MINVVIINNQIVPHSEDDLKKIQSLNKNAIYGLDFKEFNTRTITQNRSQWLWLTHIAHTLNSNNMYISKTIKAEVNWNKDSVKALIFDPIINALYQKKSSTELKKDEYEKIIDTITGIFANKGVVIPPFPNRDKL